MGMRNGPGQKGYEETCKNHYQSFWKRGIPVDVIDADCDLSGYKLVVAPMLYMLKPGVAERLGAFAEAGGTLVTTYITGNVDQSDLCFLGGFPGPLRKVVGLWSEELDALYDTDSNGLRFEAGNELGLSGVFKAHTYCERIHPETARTVAVYTDDFYAGEPAMTVNDYGKGKAWYLAARTENALLDAFYDKLSADLGLLRALDTTLPEGVTAQLRTDGRDRFVFLMNFGEAAATVALPETATDMLTGEALSGEISLAPYAVRVLRR
jgi:beta-galactosidase